LLDGFSFYELQQQGLGSYFLDSLYSDIDSLVLYGGIHAKPVGGLHRTTSRRFPFSIYYPVVDEIAIVIGVLDSRQNPAGIHEKLRTRA